MIQNFHGARYLPSAAAACLLALVLAAAASAASPSTDRSGRIRIEYGELIDRAAVTHSGRTVGAVLGKPTRKGAGLSKRDLRDLQPYLEPFSFVLNDIVAAGAPPEGAAFANVGDAYPPGSAQPAWAALFREGRFRLFVGGRRARLFLKGENPRALLGKRHGVVRHALLAALEKSGAERIGLEVYAFGNDYAGRTLILDPRPHVTEIARADCAPKPRGLPLEELAAFFARGSVLEAAEIDDGGNLYLYGEKKGETVAGRTVSLADFAVVYRSVFHHGNDPPYVSLDPSGDNRYAKVNFGGLLADTRVGSVLLEADKRLKTIVSGLDPDTRTPVADAIRGIVPDFRTVDERALFKDAQGTVRARFWFYPDRIRTVTDGRIGAVESHRFTADEERTDGKVRSYKAGRAAVDHLNRHYGSYAKALPPFGELDAVGRMMAVVKWLHATDAGRRVDLDALLSATLPPHDTPRKTLKILAVTDAVRLAPGGGGGERIKVYSFDEMLLRSDGAADDAAYVENAVRIVQRHAPGALFHDGRRDVPAGNSRYTCASISGGVSMDPANLAPPRSAPDSPLLAKFRGARSAAAGPRGRGAAPGAERRPPPAARRPAKVPPAARKELRAGTAPRKDAPGDAAMPPLAREIVVTSPSYAGKIVASGDPSRRNTIVLRKGGP